MTTQDLLEQFQEAFERGDPQVDRKQTEQENIRHLRRLYDAFLRGDLAGLLEGLVEDVDWHVVGAPAIPFAGAARGREQVAQLLGKGVEVLAEQKPEVLEVIAQGELVTVIGRETGRWRPTGLPYEGHWVHVFTFRDGKVATFREYLDSATLLAAMSAPADDIAYARPGEA
jgi:ketosteroid isomerase-like protein